MGKPAPLRCPSLDHLLKRPGVPAGSGFGSYAGIGDPGGSNLHRRPVGSLRSKSPRSLAALATTNNGARFPTAPRVLGGDAGSTLDHLDNRAFHFDSVTSSPDEADRMLDMGSCRTSRPSCTGSQRPSNADFSATLVSRGGTCNRFHVGRPCARGVCPATVAEGISQVLYPIVQEQKAGSFVGPLAKPGMKSVLVFTPDERPEQIDRQEVA